MYFYNLKKEKKISLLHLFIEIILSTKFSKIIKLLLLLDWKILWTFRFDFTTFIFVLHENFQKKSAVDFVIDDCLLEKMRPCFEGHNTGFFGIRGRQDFLYWDKLYASTASEANFFRF